MDEAFADELYRRQSACVPCLPAEVVSTWFADTLGILFPETSAMRFTSRGEFDAHVHRLRDRLVEIMACHHREEGIDVSGLADTFFLRLSMIHGQLEKDAQAMFAGDPAARSQVEVIRSYPGFYAIAAHRMAHEMLSLGVDLVPRAISEHAHRFTGIDINPGATIGEYFCIDHGTGVVIGQTAVIGDHVKIYQGVTLGALSVNKEDASSKRHPTIEDHVVIYAGATILGGNTIVGKGSVIGGNVWLTRSVPPGTKVYYTAKMTNEEGEVDTVVMKG